MSLSQPITYSQPLSQIMHLLIGLKKGVTVSSSVSFDQVRQDRSLPAHHFLRYLSVRYFVQDRLTQFSSPPHKSPLDSLIETPSEIQGTISRLDTTIFVSASIIQRIHSSSICVRRSLKFSLKLYIDFICPRLKYQKY